MALKMNRFPAAVRTASFLTGELITGQPPLWIGIGTTGHISRQTAKLPEVYQPSAGYLPITLSKYA
jgi:hypothetical protein